MGRWQRARSVAETGELPYNRGMRSAADLALARAWTHARDVCQPAA
jgi:hypothetical protein